MKKLLFLGLSLSFACAYGCGSGGSFDGGAGDVDADGPGSGGVGPGVGGTTGVGGVPGSGGDSPGTGGDGGGSLAPWNAYVMTGAEAQLASAYSAWKTAFYHDCGGGVASVTTGPQASTNRVVSEGIGYGMLITANLGTQADFDGLNNFYQSANKVPSSGLMYWECAACGSCGNGASATDGDLDVAMALLQADARWGGYAAQALAVIQNLRKDVVVETCGSLTILKPGEWGGCSDDGPKLVNPSYFAPGYFRVFAQVDAAGASIWNALVESSYELLEASKDGHHNANLLWPDGMSWNGSSFTGSTGFAGNGYDACRVPWRVATDYAWWAEPRAQALLEWVSTQIDSSGMGSLSTDANSAFYGALALSGTAVSQEKADAYYGQWTSAQLDDAPYYQGTLRVVYLMHAAGKFPSTL